MKRLALFLISVFILTSTFTINVFAAAKKDIIDAARSKIPAGYESLYMIQFENILMQVELTPEQCDRIIGIINESGRIADNNSQDIPVRYINGLCKTADLSYKYRSADSLVHTGDAVFEIYDSNGKLLGEINSGEITPVKKTGSAVLSGISIMTPVTAAVIMVIAVVIFKKNKTALMEK